MTATAPAGFGAHGAAASESSSNTLSHFLVNALHALGTEWAFGLLGGANAAFGAALGQSPIKVAHCRHEGGAGFAAAEASLASGKPCLVFATTGPGILNALNGLCAARWEGAKVILVSGVTSSQQRGRFAAQETSSNTLPVNGLFTDGPIFDFASVPESQQQLEQALTRVSLGLQRPQGYVAHLALPIAMQVRPYFGRSLTFGARRLPVAASPKLVETCAAELAQGRYAIWAGFGARHAAPELLRFAEATHTQVLCTPRAKGVFPEQHPLYLGASGMGGHESVRAGLERLHPERLLVLGTKMGEGSSFWAPELKPPNGFVHVDLDDAAFGAAFPDSPTLAVQSDVGSFLQELLLHQDQLVQQRRPLSIYPPATPLEPQPGRVRPAFLMQELQRRVVAESDALVMAESGNAFAWSTQCLHFSQPGRYRVSTGYGSMGHFASGVVGAALASNKPALALVGDGSLLMNNEINTAAALGARAIWVVLNDGRYGMVEQGMLALGYQPLQAQFPSVDFCSVAKAMGAGAVRVESEAQLAHALEAALNAAGPFVVDVVIDPDQPSPLLNRVKSLQRQSQKRETD